MKHMEAVASSVREGGLLKRPVEPHEVEIRVNGNDHISRNLDREFYAELKRLLAAASFANRFVVTVGHTTVKGTPHTRGLHIGQPNAARRGVELFWHGERAGNDARVQMILSAPPQMDPFDFQIRLKAAEKMLDELEDDDSVSGVGRKEDEHGKTVIEFPAHPHTKPEDTASTEAAPEQAAPIPALDETDLDLYMRELCGYANRLGQVARNVCEVLLRANYKVADPTGIFEAMQQRAYLLKDDEAHFKIGLRWLEFLQNPITINPTEAPPAKTEPHKDAFTIAAEKAANQTMRFVEDEAAIEAFLRNCLPSITSKGMLMRSICSEVLKKQHGYIKTGAVTESLVMRGHLEIVEGDHFHYRVAPRWLQRLRPPSETAVDATVLAQTPAPKMPPAANGSRPPSDLAAAIANLQKKAKFARELRVRLEEVDGEIRNLDSLKQGALERKARIEQSLQRPEYIEAEQRLEQVEAFLKLKF